MTSSDRSEQTADLEASVIIPVYNDADGLRVTLRSLSDQTSSSYEIIAVDNGSTDSTPQVIQTFGERFFDLVVPAAETTVQSSYAARNAGIERASGDVFLFLDADMWVEETWVEEMVTALESHDCDYLGCAVDVVVSDEPTIPERYERALSFPVETYLERKHFAPTCALAVRRDVFETVGRFDHRLESGGDKEFGQRVNRADFTQGYADEITAYHPARASFEELFSKARRIGRGRTQVRHYHPSIDTHSHPLHPINYLPPSPWRLRRRYSTSSFTVIDLLAFYTLEYGLKLTQTVSSLRETVAIRRRR
ncbi:glycosyltransferase [Halobacteria archaeon AArc-dxtr1]|nr:glycosyltransferase [Halobacteria archaeon AArc-dxtr1]